MGFDSNHDNEFSSVRLEVLDNDEPIERADEAQPVYDDPESSIEAPDLRLWSSFRAFNILCTLPVFGFRVEPYSLLMVDL